MNRFPTDQKTIVAAALLTLTLSSAIPCRALAGTGVDTSGAAQAPEAVVATAGPCSDFLANAILDGKMGFSPEGDPIFLSGSKSVDRLREAAVVELWLPKEASESVVTGYARVRIGSIVVMYPFNFPALFSNSNIDGLVKLLPGGLILIEDTGDLTSNSNRFRILDPVGKLSGKTWHDKSPMPTLLDIEGSELKFNSVADVSPGQLTYNFSFKGVDGLPSTLLMNVAMTSHQRGRLHDTIWSLVTTNTIPGYENMVQHGSVLIGTNVTKRTAESPAVPAVVESSGSLVYTILGLFRMHSSPVAKVKAIPSEVEVLKEIAIVDLLNPNDPPRTLDLDRKVSNNLPPGIPEIQVYRSDDKKVMTVALTYSDQVRWLSLSMTENQVSDAFNPGGNAKVLSDRVLPKSVIVKDPVTGINNTFRLEPLAVLFENRFVIDVLTDNPRLKVRTTDLKTGHSYMVDINGLSMSYEQHDGDLVQGYPVIPDKSIVSQVGDRYVVRLSARLGDDAIPANKSQIRTLINGAGANAMRRGTASLKGSEAELKELTAILKAAKHSGR